MPSQVVKSSIASLPSRLPSEEKEPRQDFDWRRRAYEHGTALIQGAVAVSLTLVLALYLLLTRKPRPVSAPDRQGKGSVRRPRGKWLPMPFRRLNLKRGEGERIPASARFRWLRFLRIRIILPQRAMRKESEKAMNSRVAESSVT